MESNNYTVYSHTSPKGKIYIGITKQKPNRRWHRGLGYKHNTYFYRAIEKYGWDNFKHEILCTNLTKEEAEAKEVDLIKKYKSNDRHFGYNIHSGGETRVGNTMPKGYDCTLSKKVLQYGLDGNFIMEHGGLREAGRNINKNYRPIGYCCRGNCKTAYGYQWKYKDDLKIIKPTKKGIRKPHNEALYRKVICVETGVVFESINSANEWSKSKNVSRACRFNLTSGGFSWKYYK